MNLERRLYEIACTFPTMMYKGVENGDIPGIEPDGFCAEKLNGFLHDGGGVWSSGEILVLECLLNLYSPGTYSFNPGKAIRVWDSVHMHACLKAMAQIYNGEKP